MAPHRDHGANGPRSWYRKVSTYILMKLFAFRGRKDDPAKGMAQHHALDLYRVVAMLTEDEMRAVVNWLGGPEGSEVVV